jgi:hypothetical protein
MEEVIRGTGNDKHRTQGAKRVDETARAKHLFAEEV